MNGGWCVYIIRGVYVSEFIINLSGKVIMSDTSLTDKALYMSSICILTSE